MRFSKLLIFVTIFLISFTYANAESVDNKGGQTSDPFSPIIAFSSERILNFASPVGGLPITLKDKSKLYLIVTIQLNVSGGIETDEFRLIDAGKRPCARWGIAGKLEDILNGVHYFYSTDRIAIASGSLVTIAYSTPRDFKPPLTFEFRSQKKEVNILTVSEWKKAIHELTKNSE